MEQSMIITLVVSAMITVVTFTSAFTKGVVESDGFEYYDECRASRFLRAVPTYKLALWLFKE